jgi:glutaconate CoA-transferase subunit B
MSDAPDYTLAELCITACAEAWRDDGEVLASGMGLVPRLAAGLARLTFAPGLLMNDGECRLVAEPIPVGPRDGYEPKIEGYLPFRRVFELLWGGRRHAMTMPTQIDRFGNINISFIGDPKKPKVQLLGVRGIPGNTINHPCSYFVPNHSTRSFVRDVDMASGVGHDSGRWAPSMRRDFHALRLRPAAVRLYDPLDTLLVGQGKDHAPLSEDAPVGPDSPLKHFNLSSLSEALTSKLPKAAERLGKRAALGAPALTNSLADALAGRCLLILTYEGNRAIVFDAKDRLPVRGGGPNKGHTRTQKKNKKKR